MTAPAFLENVDADERAELEGLTGILAQPLDDVGLDALASHALRIMAREQAEINRYKAAYAAEVQRLAGRYEALIEPHTHYLAQAEETVKECARRAQFVGKAKSRKVGNGQYGRKTVPEKVSITDKVLALQFAMTADPFLKEMVKQKTEYTVVHAAVVPAVLKHLKETGEVPLGFEHVGEHEETYAKPLAAEGND